jgi:hypothetical protein
VHYPYFDLFYNQDKINKIREMLDTQKNEMDNKSFIEYETIPDWIQITSKEKLDL